MSLQHITVLSGKPYIISCFFLWIKFVVISVIEVPEGPSTDDVLIVKSFGLNKE